MKIDGLTALCIIGVYCIIFGIVLTLLWNWCLVPAIPVIQKISFFQGIGIYLLSNIIFKSNIALNSNK